MVSVVEGRDCLFQDLSNHMSWLALNSLVSIDYYSMIINSALLTLNRFSMWMINYLVT